MALVTACFAKVGSGSFATDSAEGIGRLMSALLAALIQAGTLLINHIAPRSRTFVPSA